MARRIPTWDVVIAGAGPAGSLLASSLLQARPGTRVCVLDRQVFPRDKACGDGIGPGVVNTLRDLDLLRVCDGFEPVERIRLRSPNGHEVSGDLPVIDGGKPVGYVIPRLVFDHRLLQAAVARGASDYTGYGLLDAVFDRADRVWKIRARKQVDGAQREERLEARVLIGADGARSTVRRLLGLPYNPPRHTGISIRQYAAVQDAGPAALEFDFLRAIHPAYGWCFSVSKARANLGVVCDVSVYTARRLDLEAMLGKQIETLDQHHRLTPDPDTRKSFMLPYGSRQPRLAIGSAALVGDAASMINPATGEGLYYGAFAGALLGSLLAEAFSKESPVELALERYARRFRRKFRTHYRANYLIKRLAASEYWSRKAFRAAGKDSRVLKDAIRLLMGDGERMGVLNTLRILAGGIR